MSKSYNFLVILIVLVATTTGQAQTPDCCPDCSRISNGDFENPDMANIIGNSYDSVIPFELDQVTCWDDLTQTPSILPEDIDSSLNHFCVLAYNYDYSFSMLTVEGAILNQDMLLDTGQWYKMEFDYSAALVGGITTLSYYPNIINFVFSNNPSFVPNQVGPNDNLISFYTDPLLIQNNPFNPSVQQIINMEWRYDANSICFKYHGEQFLYLYPTIDTTNFNATVQIGNYIDNISIELCPQYEITYTCGSTTTYQIEIIGNNSNQTYDWQFNGFPFTNFIDNDSIVSFELDSLGIFDLAVIISDTACNGDTCYTSFTIPVESYFPSDILDSIVPTYCSVIGNGEIYTTVTSAIAAPPYTYLWSNGATTDDISGLMSGIYTVTVTDANGCSAIYSFEVDALVPYNVTDSITNIFCYGMNTGSIDLTVTNGFSPFTYSWSNSETTQDINGLVAGNYDVTILDGLGCEYNGTYTVTEPQELIAAATVTNISCYGIVDGSINLNVTGGTQPYTFQWSNGATTQNISNLNAGMYYLTVTDNNACFFYDDFQIIEPALITSTINGTNISCLPNCDGAATVLVSGGQVPYSYTWSNSGTTNMIANLCLGDYFVTIVDSAGCAVSDSVSITESLTPITIDSIIATDVSCNLNCDGTAQVFVSNAVAPISYIWSNGTTNSLATNLCIGQYYIYVEDNLGCTVIDSVSIVDTLQISIDSIQVRYNCDSSGSATIDTNFISYGTPPYTIVWYTNPQQTGLSAYNLVPGVYQVAVTDANGCTDTLTFNVTCFDVEINAINTSCPDVCNGTAEVSGINFYNGYNPTPPYTYIWSNSSTTSSVSGLCTGFYTITIVDANGYVGTNFYSIGYDYIPELTTSINHEVCDGDCNGSIEATFNGTNAFPNIIFNLEGTSTSQWQVSSNPVWDFTGLCPDTYTVIAIDQNNCHDTIIATVNGFPALYTVDTISVVDCNTSNLVNIDITTIGGNPAYSWLWSNGATTEDVTVAGQTTYYLTVTDNNLCEHIDTIFVDTIGGLTVVISPVQPTCPSSYNGQLTASASGGVSPYSYLWANGQTTETCYNIGPGQYSLTVTDDYGCTASNFGTLNNYYFLNLFDTVIPPICPATTNGEIIINVVGGVPPYTYYWEENGSPFSTQANISGLTSGNTYNLTVTDNDNCELYYTATMPDSELLLDFNVQGQGCNGIPDNAWEINGTVGVDVVGGTGSYWYDWSNGATVDSLIGLIDSTVLYVNVTDSNGCSAYDSVLIGSKQMINLKYNWGYFSTFLKPFDYLNKDISEYIIEQGLASQVEILKNEVGWPYFWPQNTMITGKFKVGEAYQTKMTTEQNLFLMGRLACPEDHEISKDPYWGFIGYLRTTDDSIVTQLSSVAQNIIIVREENGLVYWPQYGVDMIGDMIPGEGYQIKPDTLITFNFTDNDNNFGTKSASSVNDWNFQHFTDESNLFTTEFMMLMIPYESWGDAPDYGSEIGLIGENGQLVGRAIFEGEHTAFIVYGDNLYTEIEEGLAVDEEFTVSVWNPLLKSTKTLKITEWEKGDEQYEKGKICIAGKGSDDENIPDTADEMLIECMPNPSYGQFIIKVYSIDKDVASLNLYNLNGQIVYAKELNITEGWQQFVVEKTGLPAGAYTLKIICNKTNLQQKIIIIH